MRFFFILTKEYETHKMADSTQLKLLYTITNISKHFWEQFVHIQPTVRCLLPALTRSFPEDYSYGFLTNARHCRWPIGMLSHIPAAEYRIVP